jgi:hypothetical protein
MADLYYIQKTNEQGQTNLLPNVFFEVDKAQLYLDEYQKSHVKLKLEIIVVEDERKELINSNSCVDSLTKDATYNEKLAINTILSVLENEHLARKTLVRDASKKSRLPQVFIASLLEKYNNMNFFWSLTRVHSHARRHYVSHFRK